MGLAKFAYCKFCFFGFNFNPNICFLVSILTLIILSSAAFHQLIPAEDTKGQRTFDQSFCTILILVQRSTLQWKLQIPHLIFGASTLEIRREKNEDRKAGALGSLLRQVFPNKAPTHRDVQTIKYLPGDYDVFWDA